MGVDHHKSTACMQRVVYNVWPVVNIKWSMSCFSWLCSALMRDAMSNRQQSQNPSSEMSPWHAMINGIFIPTKLSWWL